LTHTSIGPSCASARSATAKTLVGVGDVRGERQRSPAGLVHLARRRLQAVLAAGDEPDRRAQRSERPRGRAPDTGRGAGHDDDGPIHGLDTSSRAHGRGSFPVAGGIEKPSSAWLCGLRGQGSKGKQRQGGAAAGERLGAAAGGPAAAPGDRANHGGSASLCGGDPPWLGRDAARAATAGGGRHRELLRSSPWQRSTASHARTTDL
jgi:hypothetical protein